MLRGGATKKGVYNVFGFDGTGLGRTTVTYQSKYAPGTIVVGYRSLTCKPSTSV